MFGFSCIYYGCKVLHPGAAFGGCRNQYGSSLCDTPFVRLGHSASMNDNFTMLICGGYSQECEDYCDDIWTFDFLLLEWKKIEVDSISSTPGRRWKFSMVSSVNNGTKERKDDDTTSTNSAILFGGHRLWHDFAVKNSEENLLQNTTQLILLDVVILACAGRHCIFVILDGNGNGILL